MNWCILYCVNTWFRSFVSNGCWDSVCFRHVCLRFRLNREKVLDLNLNVDFSFLKSRIFWSLVLSACQGHAKRDHYHNFLNGRWVFSPLWGRNQQVVIMNLNFVRAHMHVCVGGAQMHVRCFNPFEVFIMFTVKITLVPIIILCESSHKLQWGCTKYQSYKTKIVIYWLWYHKILC
jgi:hypothetical protein